MSSDDVPIIINEEAFTEAFVPTRLLHGSSMDRIASEFVDLTELDWVSLVHSSKLALPLILVQLNRKIQ